MEVPSRRKKRGSPCFLVLLNFVSLFYPWGKPAASLTAQTQLKQLDIQIHQLQKNLATDHGRKETLNQKLAHAELQMSEGIHSLYSIEKHQSEKKRKIAQLQQQMDHLSQQLENQKNLLAQQIRARYHMGEYQPLKWLVNQEDPHQYSRILSYFQYLIQSHKQLINQIEQIKTNLSDSANQINQEFAESHQLEIQILQHQKTLKENKTQQVLLLKSLNQKIQSKEHTLIEAQRNRNNLTILLQSLAQKHPAIPNKPFQQMRKKLPIPVHTAHRTLKKMNQGLTFFADEGTVVTAVYPGKVVFSDWLKGYGLLLIIDHGQGFMTLYAHNQSLFKKQGERVSQNEQIATVGHSGGLKENGLYFELRLDGKAISPLGWLT